MTSVLKVREDTTSVQVDGVDYPITETEDNGRVIEVNNGAHAGILSRPPFGFETVVPAAADAAPPEQEQEQESAAQDMLLGSSILPALVDVGGEAEVQLGDIVARAHAESGLSVADWNALPEDTRESMLGVVVKAMREENGVAEEPAVEESDEVKALRALDFAGAEFPNKTTLVKWLNDNGVADADDGMGRPVLEGLAADRRDAMVAELTKPEAAE